MRLNQLLVPGLFLLGTAFVEAEPPRKVVNGVGMSFVPIRAGSFHLGSAGDDRDALPGEKPQREVRITQGFYLGVHEVTQAQYRAVMGVNPSWFSERGGGRGRVKGRDTRNLPVEMVSWLDADAFCKALSAQPVEKRAGRSYRLPTEAEWEYACRAGSRTAFHHGDRLSSDEANFHGFFPHGGAPRGGYLARTRNVGSYEANAWGLFDVHGNVWEWCADWYDPRGYATAAKDDPRGPRTGEQRVLRGGSWYGKGRSCRSANRAASCPRDRFYTIGFRVACDIRERK